MKIVLLFMNSVLGMRMLDPSPIVSGIECPVCIRTGNIFCTNALYLHANDVYSVTYENYCCTALDTINCPNAYSGGVLKTTLTCSSSISSKDLAVASCP